MLVRTHIPLLVLATLTASTHAWGAGYEKVTNWSGRFGGLAGAATALATGSEALYFNPAGLATGKGPEVSLNFSPTFGQYEGPVTAPNTSLSSSRKLSPVFGALAGTQLTPQFGVGLGAYVSGGTKAIFEDVDFSGVNAAFDTLKPEVKSELSVTELALGGAYELIPGLRVGLAWRLTMVKAGLAIAQTGSTPVGNVANIVVDDISKTRWNGFKLGAQYASMDGKWGLGAAWRTPITFTAKGSGQRRVETVLSNTIADTNLGDIYLSSIFPSQVSVGGFYEVIPNLKIIPEIVWTEYSQAKSLTLTGGLNSAIPQNWQNQVNAKLAVETGLFPEWALRAGYAWTSRVTPKANARATFASPGSGSTLTLGTGTELMDRKLELNGAFEYSFASGDVSASDSAGTALPGEYSTNAFVFHLGATYRL